VPAATVALDTFSDPKLWTPEEQQQPAMYLHRLIVRRKYSGLGTDVIEWACKRAGELGNNWVRIDVWTDNVGLHRYYEQRGFHHVRTLDMIDYPSGALFQRKATDRRETRTDAVITDLTHDLTISRQQPGTSARVIRPALLPSIS
jgi:predicted N-acetyltransferase YhbS